MENKRNYQRELDDILKRIEKNEKKPVLLLHSCCGPCSSYVLEYLTQYFYIKLFFYNPNIQPSEEYSKRLLEQKKIIDISRGWYRIADDTERNWSGGVGT